MKIMMNAQALFQLYKYVTPHTTMRSRDLQADDTEDNDQTEVEDVCNTQGKAQEYTYDSTPKSESHG